MGEAESAARAAVERLDKEIRDWAAGMLLTPHGGDAPARAEATSTGQREVSALESSVTAAVEEVGGLEAEYRSFQPQERSLEPYGRPRDIPHGEQLIETATADWDKSRVDLDQVKERKETLTGQVAGIERLLGALSAVRESLSTLVSPPPDREAAAFQVTVQAAR